MAVEDLSERLTRMERVHRRTVSVGAGLACLVIGVAAIGQSAFPAKVMKAEEFQVVDAKGECRGVFHATDEGVSLVLYGQDKKTEAYVRIPSKGGAEIALSDSKGTTRVWQYVTPAGECGTTLFRKESTPAVLLHAGESATSLRLFALEPSPRVSVDVTMKEGARFIILDKEDKEIVCLPGK